MRQTIDILCIFFHKSPAFSLSPQTTLLFWQTFQITAMNNAFSAAWVLLLAWREVSQHLVCLLTVVNFYICCQDERTRLAWQCHPDEYPYFVQRVWRWSCSLIMTLGLGIGMVIVCCSLWFHAPLLMHVIHSTPQAFPYSAGKRKH